MAEILEEDLEPQVLRPLGPLIDEIFEIREQKRRLDEESDALGKLIKSKEVVIMAEMQAQGLDRAAGRKARVGINETVVAQIEDFDRLWAFIRRNNLPELLHRRVSDAVYRELAERRKDHTIPGLVPFTKRTLSLQVDT